MKQLLLIAVAVVGLIGCTQQQDAEAAKEAVKAYMQKTTPGYAPSGFLPVVPFARKDSIIYHRIRTGQGPKESTDKTPIGLYLQHGYRATSTKAGMTDTALFVVMKDGRVIQLWPWRGPSPL